MTTARLLSIDVEDPVIAGADLYLRDAPSAYEDSVGSDMRATLDVLEATGARATLFVNARYCDRHRSIFSEAVTRGHVLASHGHHHYDVRRISLDRFRDDLRRSLDVLTAYQDPIVGYRPPAFTMPFDEPHLDVLREEGIRYVSCGDAFPRSNFPRTEVPAVLDNGLHYVPISVWSLLGRRIRYPVGYGAVARLMPSPLSLAAVGAWVRRQSFLQFYFHPYELSGMTRRQRRLLLEVTPGDRAMQVLSLRTGRAALFAQVFRMCHFEPIESLPELAD